MLRSPTWPSNQESIEDPSPDEHANRAEHQPNFEASKEKIQIKIRSEKRETERSKASLENYLSHTFPDNTRPRRLRLRISPLNWQMGRTDTNKMSTIVTSTAFRRGRRTARNADSAKRNSTTVEETGMSSIQRSTPLDTAVNPLPTMNSAKEATNNVTSLGKEIQNYTNC